MNNQLQIFEHEEFGKIRVLDIEGEPWFVGRDVAQMLGYSNLSRDINRHVDEEDRRIFQNYQNGIFETPNRGVTIINESGLYALIFGSKLPAARAFKQWVTSDVLTTIRRRGAYITPETLEEMLINSDFAKSVVCELYVEQKKNEALLDRVEELSPKAKYCDLILKCQNALSVSVIAKDYGMSAVTFNRLLHSRNIQYRVGSTWVLYQRFSGKGYTKSNTYYTPTGTGIVYTSWTQSGRRFLYEILAAAGILPVMESGEAC